MNIDDFTSGFKPFEGLAKPGILDFAGCIDLFTRDGTLPSFEDLGELTYRKSSPIKVDEEIFEWIDLIQSIKNASENFWFVELGAGYGRWAARAYKLARAYGFSDQSINLITVEADDSHSAYLHQHFTLNEVKANHYHFSCAVSNFTGEMDFYVSRPNDTSRALASSQWFGQSLAHFGWENAQKEKVQVQRLSDILSFVPGVKCIDLIDCDLQGEDSKVLLDSIAILEYTKMVHVGTDNLHEESVLREFFSNMRWTNLWDFSNTGKRSTTFGEIVFVDGVQTWSNPKFRNS